MDSKYSIDDFGVVHQVDPEPFIYDSKYVQDRYDSLPDHGMKMSYLRLGTLLSHVHGIKDVLDVGYGNGAFLDACFDSGMCTYGYDVSGYRPNRNHLLITESEIIDWKVDVVTFFDSLEHIPDLRFLADLKTRFIMVSVPWYHPELGMEWFHKWKHRRPNEHLHHFFDKSIQDFFGVCGYKIISLSNVEDCIRIPVDGHQNIMTCIFEKIK